MNSNELLNIGYEESYHSSIPNVDQLGLYEIRMNEFCINYLNKGAKIQNENLINPAPKQPIATRPKCSISPINLSSNIVDNSIVTNSNDFERNSNESYNQAIPNNINLSHISPFVNKVDGYNRIYQPTAVSALPTISLYDSGIQQSYENNSSNASSICTSSPYYLTRTSAFRNTNPNKRESLSLLNGHLKKSIRFQSTPNKASLKNNHLSLPESFPNSSSIESIVPVLSTTASKVNFHSILELAKSDQQSNDLDEKSIAQPLPTSSSNENLSGFSNSSNCNSSSIITFNEHLRNLSLSLSNKENSQQDFITRNKRKPRTQISRQQKEILEYAYKLKSYPDSNEVEYLCNILGFEENVIRIWFQNKRARDKQRRL